MYLFFYLCSTYQKKKKITPQPDSFFYILRYRILDEDKDAKEAKEQEGHQEQQVVDGE